MIHYAGAMHKIIEGYHFDHDQKGNTSIQLCHFHLVILRGY